MEKQQQILSDLILQTKEEIYNLEQEVAQAEKAANEYPATFKGTTVLDFQEWDAGRKQVTLELEAKQQGLRHAYWKLDDLQKQQQLKLF